MPERKKLLQVKHLKQYFTSGKSTVKAVDDVTFDIYEGEIPVFWPCGVTPQAAIENAKLPIVITHAPGHMFITDILNSELNDYLEAQKNK